MKRDFLIQLEAVRFFARHGVFESERISGNEFIVNLAVKYSPEAHFSPEADSLDDTICYASLFDIVKKEMDTPRNLLETVACRITDSIHQSFPQATFIECKITKSVPPIPEFNGSASVTCSLTV